jgi:hypothetical protein
VVPTPSRQSGSMAHWQNVRRKPSPILGKMWSFAECVLNKGSGECASTRRSLYFFVQKKDRATGCPVFVVHNEIVY